jgi:hypothetical protein
VMEGIASTLSERPKDKKPIQFHVTCFQIWDAERRRPQERSAEPSHSFRPAGVIGSSRGGGPARHGDTDASRPRRDTGRI